MEYIQMVVGGLTTLNTLLIGANVYLAKSWKEGTDINLRELSKEVNGLGQRIARIEGRMNGTQ